MKNTAIVNETSLNLKAFKRGRSLERSKWYMGCLTNLAESNDTNGAFFLVEVTMAPGNEPPPHVHSYEDELFYVLDGAVSGTGIETGTSCRDSRVQVLINAVIGTMSKHPNVANRDLSPPTRSLLRCGTRTAPAAAE